MKTFIKCSILLVFLSAPSIFIAQENVLQLANEERGIVRTITENKRVRVKTKDGLKFKGKLVIVDKNTIAIDNTPIPLESIEKIKRDPLLLNILSSTGFIYLGAITIGLGVLIGVLADSAAIIPTALVGGGFITLGLLSPSYIPARKMSNGWDLSVQTINIK